MIGKYSNLIQIFALVLTVNCQYNFEINDFRIGTLFNRITNTTLDVIRGGVNLFGKTIDRIVNTFVRIEDRLRALLEVARLQIIKGIPELNIPVLDPLTIQKIAFDLNIEAANLKGNAQDVVIRHISKFVVDDEKFSSLGNLKFKLNLNLTFPYIHVNGSYKVNGTVGKTFRIYGEGPFKLNLIDLKIQTSTILVFTLPTKLRVENTNINIKLRKLKNNFENLMSDPETGRIINKAISNLAPEALDILWPDVKSSIEAQVKKYINNIFENATVVNIAKRVFNIS